MGRKGHAQPTIEAACAIVFDVLPVMRPYIRALRGSEIVQPVAFRRITWTWRRDGEPWCSATCTMSIDRGGDTGTLRMCYAPPDVFGDGHGAQDLIIDLVTTRPRFGGLQWWFLCPASGRRCRKLFLPAGGRRFLSRQAYGLAYHSQRTTDVDRAQRRIGKLCRRLGGEWGVSAIDLPPKPKWMRWATYQRFEAAAWEAEEILDRDLMRFVGRLRLKD